MRTDCTSSDPEDNGDQLGENIWFGPVIRLGGAVGSAPACRAWDPGSNSGPGDNFSLKVTT